MTRVPSAAARGPRRPVVVRWARIDQAPVDADALDHAARQRNDAFHDDADRRRFVGARLLLLQVVTEVTGCGTRDVVLRQTCSRCGGPHGPPVVELRGRRGPEVSVAHAGDVAVVALARAAVGVDVEPEGSTADVRGWVRGEAVVKATKHGLDVDRSLFDVTGPAPSPWLSAWRGPGRAPRMHLRDLDFEPGYVGAVARLGRTPLRLDAERVTLTLP